MDAPAAGSGAPSAAASASIAPPPNVDLSKIAWELPVTMRAPEGAVATWSITDAEIKAGAGFQLQVSARPQNLADLKKRLADDSSAKVIVDTADTLVFETNPIGKVWHRHFVANRVVGGIACSAIDERGADFTKEQVDSMIAAVDTMALATPRERTLDLSPLGPGWQGYVATVPADWGKIDVDGSTRHIVLTGADFVDISQAPGFADAMAGLSKTPENTHIRVVSPGEVHYQRGTEASGPIWSFDYLVPRADGEKWSCAAETQTGAWASDKLFAICKSIHKR